MSWASNDGWEDSSWGVITSKASFAHTRAIVYDKSGNVFVTHLGFFVFLNQNETKVCVFNGRWLTSEPRYARYLYYITFCPNVCLTQATLLCHEPKYFLGYKVATCASLSCKHARGQGSIRLSNHIFLGWQPYIQSVSKNVSKNMKIRIF